MRFINSLIWFFICSAWLSSCKNNESQHPPFWDEIQAYKKADSLNPPPANVVLFVGSSSFRLWENLEATFKEYNALNRGFGGSNLLDLNYYAKDIIFPYKPRQIVIYSGENDIGTDTVSAEMVLDRFKTFYSTIRSKMPEVPIAYVSIKPSPGREHLLHTIRESNKLIKSYLASQRNAEFIDVFPLLLSKDRKLRRELYKEDQLHMNAQGYEIWEKAIRPYLIKE